ncbi:hypothetical protein [Microbacterium suwonense]|uniref:Uncharacterized protein n=1 Tax=Microbacterium suwonense TaxID=683047 RepID=A0ABM8FXW4_9MICO|nr:hypothetical protein [Microbacterium suwonense]BDZ40582.1 hypothetical protein GCM10025863_31960 [Microbacterium suwonense]
MTTTRDPHEMPSSGVSAFLALVIGFVLFAALGILGLGMLSFFADVDILDVPGLEWWPGIVGMIAAIGAFAWMLWPALVRERPSFLSIMPVALIAAVAHVFVVAACALLGGAGMASALTAVAQLVTRGSSGVLMASALIAAWVAIALRRTRGSAPSWPWEHQDTE